MHGKTVSALYGFLALSNLALISFSFNREPNNVFLTDDQIKSGNHSETKRDEVKKFTPPLEEDTKDNFVHEKDSKVGVDDKFTNSPEPEPPQIINASLYFASADTMDFETSVKFWERSVCGESAVCLDDIKNATIDSPFNCGGCFCDGCIYGDCCLDKVFGGEASRSQLLAYTSCTTPSKELTDRQHEGYYIFVTSCPHNYSYGTIRKNCEDPPNQVETILDNPPMYSLQSQISYLNTDCAECHNDIDHLETWTSQITCTKALSISDIKTIDDLTEIIKAKDCQLLFDPPKDSLFRNCEIGVNQTISKCNITGDWDGENKDLETACGMYTNPLTVDLQRYRNMFCALCNGKRSSILEYIEKHTDTKRQPVPSFSIVFNLRQKQESSDILTCPEDSVLLKKGNCRKLACSPGRLLFSRACTDAFKTAKGLGYRLRFRMLASHQPIFVQRGDTDKFWTAFKSQIAINHNADLLKLDVWLFNFAITVCTESTFLNNVFLMQDVTADLHTVIGGDVSQSLAELTLMKLFGTEFIFEKVVWRLSSGFTQERSKNNLMCDGFSSSTFAEKNRKEYLKNATLLIPLTPLSRCNQIELSPEEYYLNHTTGQLETNVTDIKYQRGEYITDGDKVRICINVSQPEAEISDFEATMEKLTAVSMGVSICCLSLSIAVCLISNSHNTLPGKITMALVLTLIVAQLLFITSGQAYGIIWPCRLFGMGLHYFWLSVFAWKHVAGYHMYMSFVHPLRKRSSQVVSMIRYTMYSFGIPLLIVVCYTTTHLILSNKEHIGYGDETCFLSGPIDIGVAFALPVSIVIVCNVFFFVRVVRAICKMSEVQKHSNRPNTNHSIIFMKMSVVLGFTWIIGFFANVENNHMLWYTFAVLNGGVGAFIFIGQVWNKNLLLRAKRWMSLAYQQDSSVTLTSNTAKSATSVSKIKTESLTNAKNTKPEKATV